MTALKKLSGTGTVMITVRAHTHTHTHTINQNLLIPKVTLNLSYNKKQEHIKKALRECFVMSHSLMLPHLSRHLGGCKDQSKESKDLAGEKADYTIYVTWLFMCPDE